MRVFVVTLLLLSILSLAYGQSAVAPDLPPPAGSTRSPSLVTFAAGSLIIDMGDYQIEDTTVAGTQAPSNHQLTIGHVYPCGTSSSTINCTIVSGQGNTASNCAGNTWCDTCQRVNASRAGQFNLYAYGLAIRMLYQKIPLFWAIKSGKTSTTDYDIVNAQAYRSHPTRSPVGLNAPGWGLTTTSSVSFRGGPIIIRAADADAAMQVLNSTKAGYGSGKGRFESIVIFTLSASAQIDVRHNLTHLPYVYSSTLDGSWCDWSPIPMILMNAGLLEGPINNISATIVNQHHWSLLTQSAELIAFSNTTCSTLFAEPHIIFDDSGNCASGRCVSTPQYRAPLSEFVQSGGNFWVQCAGIASYENSLWNSQYYPPAKAQQQGAFISKYGVQGLGNTGNEWGGRIDSTWVYTNPDLPVSQFVGNLGNQTGTISGFYLRSDPSPALPESSLWANNGFSIASTTLAGGDSNAPYNKLSATQNNMGSCSRCCPNATSISPRCAYNNLLPSGRTAHIAAGAKLTNPYNANSHLGGLVWMVGGHSWFTNYNAGTDSSYPSDKVEDINLRNGQRMFLNALLVPAVRPANCLHNFCSQDVDCTSQYGACYNCSATGTCIAPPTCPLGLNIATCTCNAPSASRTPSSSVSPSTPPSFSSTSSNTNTASATRSTTNTATPTSSSSITPSRSASTTPSFSSSVSPSSGASQSTTPSSSTSISRSSTQSPSVSSSTTTSLSSTHSPSISSSASTSWSRPPSNSFSGSASNSFSPSTSKSPSQSPSQTPSTSHTPSNSQTPSSSNSPVILAGGGGDNTGTIVGAVVGAVGGVAVVGGVVAAGAAVAVVIAKKSAAVTLDSGAISGSDAFTNTVASPVYEGTNATVENPLYAS